MERLLKPLWILLVAVVAVCLGYYVRATWPADSPIERTVLHPTRQALPSSSAPLEGEPFRIAAVLPLSAAKQSLGYSMLDAIEMAAAEINALGGVDGRPIAIVPVNGACDSATAGKNLELALENDRIDAIIGGICSEETLGIAPIANTRRILTIAPSGSDDLIAKAGRYVFRLVPSDSSTALAKAEYDKTHDGDMTLRPFFDERAPAAQKFFSDYRTHFDTDPLPPWYLANAYSAVYAISDLVASGTPSEGWPDTLVRDGLGPVGCLPRIEFDRNGDPVWREFVASDGSSGMNIDVEVFETE